MESEAEKIFNNEKRSNISYATILLVTSILIYVRVHSDIRKWWHEYVMNSGWCYCFVVIAHIITSRKMTEVENSHHPVHNQLYG